MRLHKQLRPFNLEILAATACEASGLIPTLLLDYDGVLHPDCVYRTRGGGVVLKRDGLSLFEWAPLLNEALAPHPDIEIVLSTTWVDALGFDAARNALPEPLQKRVTGSTRDPFLAMARWKRMERGEQIRRYVLHRHLDNWVAIDDSVESWPPAWEGRLVRCDPDLGLAEPGKIEQLAAALSLLKPQSPNHEQPRSLNPSTTPTPDQSAPSCRLRI